MELKGKQSSSGCTRGVRLRVTSIRSEPLTQAVNEDLANVWRNKHERLEESKSQAWGGVDRLVGESVVLILHSRESIQ